MVRYLSAATITDWFPKSINHMEPGRPFEIIQLSAVQLEIKLWPASILCNSLMGTWLKPPPKDTQPLKVYIRIFPSTAMAIKCYQCVPDPLAGETCQHPTNITTCEQFYDSCTTLSIRIKTSAGELSSSTMICGLRGACDPVDRIASCDAVNASVPMLTECSLSCCQEDLCNSGPPTVAPTTATGKAPTTIATNPENASRTVATKAGKAPNTLANWGAIFASAVLSLHVFQASIWRE